MNMIKKVLRRFRRKLTIVLYLILTGQTLEDRRRYRRIMFLMKKYDTR